MTIKTYGCRLLQIANEEKVTICNLILFGAENTGVESVAAKQPRHRIYSRLIPAITYTVPQKCQL